MSYLGVASLKLDASGNSRYFHGAAKHPLFSGQNETLCAAASSFEIDICNLNSCKRIVGKTF
jgi:hypothetical protein